MTIADLIPTFSETIQAISVIIAAITIIVGVNAWKREFVGKRRIELAENVLTLFYEAQDAIREIRNPFSFVGEGSSRKRSEHESEDEAKILDTAYVVFERYHKREKLFAELRAMKYKFMATFGSDAGEPFVEIDYVINDILSAAYILGRYYWQRQGRIKISEEEFQKHLEGMRKFESKIWTLNFDNDVISQRVQNAVEKIEGITRKESMNKGSWFKKKKE